MHNIFSKLSTLALYLFLFIHFFFFFFFFFTAMNKILYAEVVKEMTHFLIAKITVSLSRMLFPNMPVFLDPIRALKLGEVFFHFRGWQLRWLFTCHLHCCKHHWNANPTDLPFSNSLFGLCKHSQMSMNINVWCVFLMVNFYSYTSISFSFFLSLFLSLSLSLSLFLS